MCLAISTRISIELERVAFTVDVMFLCLTELDGCLLCVDDLMCSVCTGKSVCAWVVSCSVY